VLYRFGVTSRPELTRLPGRQRDSRTAGALIDAVLDLVSEGATLSGMSFVAIAERAGVSRNSLYRRWKTKDALFLDVLASLNRPVPALSGHSVREDVIEMLSTLVERSLDQRASQMLRSLSAEAIAFPELRNRYFAEVVAPRRAMLLGLLQRGVDTGEIAHHVDIELAADVLVDPILAGTFFGTTPHSQPVTTARFITELVFGGLAPRD